MGLRLVLLVSFAALIAGCVDYDLGQRCESDADCEGDQFCYAGLCRDPLACEQDADCPAGQVCLDGTCLPPDCSDDDDCPESSRCIDHRCVGCACATDADCPPGMECRDGCICVEFERPCDDDADCGPLETCVDGFCQPRARCEDDADCAAGEVCENGVCTPGCIDDADCGQFQLCVDGRCRQRCFGDATCLEPDQICVDGVCVDAECTSDADCAGELQRCRDGRCEEYTPCESDADCGDPNWVCIDGVCEELPGCAIDANCAPGEICIDDHCHPAPACETEADCAADEDCIGGLCLPHVCRGDADCSGDAVCVGGECVPPGDPARVYEVVILTPGGPIRQGHQIQLSAIALTQSGAAVAGVDFDWSSSQPERAAVDAAGLLTGGDQAGATEVRASASGSGRQSRPVTFINMLAADPQQVRLTAVAAVDRAPVAGAVVWLDDGVQLAETVTDAQGVAVLPLGQTPFGVHVFANGRDAVSLLQTSSTDLLVPLPERRRADEAGGYVGQMEFSGEGMLSLGLAGLSAGGDLLQFDFTSLMGEIFRVPVEFNQMAFELPLPAQLVLGLAYGDMPIRIKPDYHVVGDSGLRTAWAFGGRLELAVFGELFGGAGVGDVLGSLLPYFSLLRHDIRPVQDVRALPLVVDENDIDGDGDSEELRPNWEAFPDVDLAPTQEQSLALQVIPPPPPAHPTEAVDTALVVAGALGELGFTPLGLSSTRTGDAGFDPVMMKLAPAHGGLEVGRYAVLVMALPGTAAMATPSDVATVIYTGDSLPTDVDFAHGFIGFAEDAFFHRATRTLLASGVAGAELLRLRLDGPDGGWTVWLPALDLIQLSLPSPPEEVPDPVAGARVELTAIDLRAGLGYEDLVLFDGADLDRLDELTRATSQTELQ